MDSICQYVAMKDRAIKIVDAAIRLFSRYGVKRTNMNDIAQEAEIARQTLYNCFANKEAVLQATIRLLTDRAIVQIEHELEGVSDLGDQLDVVFKHIAVEPFDLLQSAPNSEEIVSGFNASSQQELATAAERNVAIIKRLVTPAKTAIESNGLTLDQFADFIQRSAAGAKYSADSRKHLLKLLSALKIAALKVANE